MATSTKIASLTIENTEFPLLTPTIITQELVEKNGNFIPFDRLAQLRVALDALQPNPPDAKTVWFDDTILLQDASGNDSLTINPTSIQCNNGLIEMLSDTNNIEMRVGENVDGSALVLLSASGLARIETSDRLRLTSDGMTIISTDFLELDCQSGIDAKSGNFNLTNLNGGGSIITLDDVVDNIQMTVEASAGNTGLFTNDSLSFQCENMGVRVRQGTSVINSDTNLIEFQITEDVDNSILRFTSTDPSATIESSNNLSVQCENMNTVVRQGNFRVDSDTNRMEMTLGENVNGSALQFVTEDPSAIIESNNALIVRSAVNLSLEADTDIYIGSNTAGNIQTSTDNFNMFCAQGNFTGVSGTTRMEQVLLDNVGNSLTCSTQSSGASIESSNDFAITSGGNLTLNCPGNLVLDATTIDFQNTSTTTSTSIHNANIKTTTNGLETNKFLKVKMNGNDIWIPYFETDPSL